MTQCPFCDLMFDSEEAAVQHAIRESASHAIAGFSMAPYPNPTSHHVHCWCSGPYFSIAELIGHMGNHGGYRLHALDLLLGLERVAE